MVLGTHAVSIVCQHCRLYFAVFIHSLGTLCSREPGTVSSCCPVVFVVCTESMSLCCRLSLLDPSSCRRGRFIKHSGACQVMGMTAMAVGKRMQWPASVPCMPRSRGAGQREKAVRAHRVMGVAAKWSTGSAPTTSLAHTHGREETRSPIRCQDWGDLEGRGPTEGWLCRPREEVPPKSIQRSPAQHYRVFVSLCLVYVCMQVCAHVWVGGCSVVCACMFLRYLWKLVSCVC